MYIVECMAYRYGALEGFVAGTGAGVGLEVCCQFGLRRERARALHALKPTQGAEETAPGHS